MKRNKLGNSELQVSEIAVGCMSLKPDHPNPELVIGKALDAGINFFDTADLYDFGLNEEMLGRALTGKRHELVLATKVGNRFTPGQEGWQWDPSKAYIIGAIENSLRRLNTDYIDLYQLHGGTIDDPIDETIEAFEQLKEQGKIRAYGISSIRPNVIREYAQRSNIVSVMMQYSLLDRRPEESCLQLLEEKSISVITRGTLAKGLLAGKAAQEYLGYSVAEVAKVQHTLQELPGKASHHATNYVLKAPAIASAVIGFRTLEQLEDLTSNFSTDQLSGADRSHLGSILEPNKYTAHR